MESVLLVTGEIWVVDNINYGVLVYDNTGEWPVLKMTFPTTASADWITMGLDGKYAFLSSGDVVDVKTKKIVGQMKDEQAVLYGINLLALPAAAVPTGLTDGVPMGVQIVGQRFREDLCLDAAQAIETRVGVLAKQLWERV